MVVQEQGLCGVSPGAGGPITGGFVFLTGLGVLKEKYGKLCVLCELLAGERTAG